MKKIWDNSLWNNLCKIIKNYNFIVIVIGIVKKIYREIEIDIEI